MVVSDAVRNPPISRATSAPPRQDREVGSCQIPKQPGMGHVALQIPPSKWSCHREACLETRRYYQCLQPLLLGELRIGLGSGLELLNVPTQIPTTLVCSLGEGRGKSVAAVASMSGGAAPHAP